MRFWANPNSPDAGSLARDANAVHLPAYERAMKAARLGARRRLDRGYEAVVHPLKSDEWD